MATRGQANITGLLIGAIVAVVTAAILVIILYFMQEKVVTDLGLSANATTAVQGILNKGVTISNTAVSIIFLLVVVALLVAAIMYLRGKFGE